MHDLVSLNDQFFGVQFQLNLRSSKYAIWIDPEKKKTEIWPYIPGIVPFILDLPITHCDIWWCTYNLKFPGTQLMKHG
jgi:hypothetical protein